MNREQLFDLTERVKLVAGVQLPVIVGSQSLYGVTFHVPDIVKRSVECDFLLLSAWATADTNGVGKPEYWRTGVKAT